MKKVSLLILLVMVASLLMGAAIPTKLVTLTIINKSDYDVFMKLEGSAVTKAYYYLTIPKGSRDDPMVKVYTVYIDVYQRTTWQCDGLKSTGTLVVDGNIRLTFTPCGQPECTWSVTHLEIWGCPYLDENNVQHPGQLVSVTTTHRRGGEPRMEKVTYFKYLVYGTPYWSGAINFNGYWNFGCFTFYYRLKTYKLPIGCAYRYQY